MTVDVSKYHDSRIDRQFEKTGSDGADVAMLQTLHDFKRWKEAGRLLPYKVANWEEIYSSLKDPSGAFVAISISKFYLPRQKECEYECPHQRVLAIARHHYLSRTKKHTLTGDTRPRNSA